MRKARARAADRQTTSFIDNSIEAGILLGGNGVLHAMVVAHVLGLSLRPLMLSPTFYSHGTHAFFLLLWPYRFLCRSARIILIESQGLPAQQEPWPNIRTLCGACTDNPCP